MTRWLPWALLVCALAGGAALEGYRAGQLKDARAAEKQARKDAQHALDSADAIHAGERAAALDSLRRADSAFHMKQVATAATIANYKSVIAQLSALMATDTTPADTAKRRLLAAVGAACDSLGAAASDTMPCHRRIAARDSVIGADSLERRQLLAADTARQGEVAALKKQIPGWFGRLGGTFVKTGGGVGLGIALACLLFHCGH